MVQIIQGKNKPQTAGERFMQAFANAGQAAGRAIPEFLEAQKSERQNQEQTKKLGEITEQDLEGLSPEAQVKLLEGFLSQRKAESVEQLKSQKQQDLIKKRMEAYQNLLSGGSGNPQQKSLETPQPKGILSPEFGGAFPGQKQDFAQQLQRTNPSLSNEQIAASSIVDPNLARILQHQNDVNLRENRAERELNLQQKKASPEFRRDQALESAQAQADVKYNQQLQESSKQHALKEQSLNNLELLNNKGVTGKTYEKLLEKGGLVNLTSDGRREFSADVKNLITDIRSILGAQFTGFEFQTILNAYPSADFSQGANAAIIRNLKNFQDIKSKEVQFAHQIKKENGGKIPLDFQSLVNERVHEYAATKADQIKNDTKKIINEEYGIPEGYTLMFDPKGEKLRVPDQDIEKYLDLGAILP